MLTIIVGIICFFIGEFFGIIVTAMLSASSINDRISEIEKDLYIKYRGEENEE